jgi:hypothetical protein
MKKLAFVSMLAIALVSCSKEETAEITEPSQTNQEVQAQDSTISMNTKTTYTVTTESALKSAVSAAKAGDVIKISGTIKLTSTLQLLNSGTSSSKITLTGTSSSSLGVLNCSSVSGWGVKCNGSYWNIEYLDICYSGDCGMVFQTGGYNYVYYCRFYGNGDSGFQIYNSSYSNSVNYCWSWDNYDEANGGENADGFACKLSAGSGNTYNHCEASHNSDDGWDLYSQPKTVKMNYCTAKYNGYGTNGDGNGFKLGSSGQTVAHTVYYCTSNYNLKCGYDGNGNTGHITTTGSSGTGNGSSLWCRIY